MDRSNKLHGLVQKKFIWLNTTHQYFCLLFYGSRTAVSWVWGMMSGQISQNVRQKSFSDNVQSFQGETCSCEIFADMIHHLKDCLSSKAISLGAIRLVGVLETFSNTKFLLWCAHFSPPVSGEFYSGLVLLLDLVWTPLNPSWHDDITLSNFECIHPCVAVCGVPCVPVRVVRIFHQLQKCSSLLGCLQHCGLEPWSRSAPKPKPELEKAVKLTTGLVVFRLAAEQQLHSSAVYKGLPCTFVGMVPVTLT